MAEWAEPADPTCYVGLHSRRSTIDKYIDYWNQHEKELPSKTFFAAITATCIYTNLYAHHGLLGELCDQFSPVTSNSRRSTVEAGYSGGGSLKLET